MSSVGRNLRWLLASETVARAIGFLYTAILARLLGLELFGLLTLAYAYSEILGLVAGMSFHEILIRDAAADPRRLVPSLALMVSLQLVGLILIAAAGAALGFAYGGALGPLLFLGALLGWVRSLGQTFLAVPASRSDLRPSSVYAVLDRVLGVCALPVLLLAPRNLVAYFLALLAASIVSLLYTVRVASTHGAFQGWPARPLTGWRGLLREGVAFSSLRWIGVIYNRLDTVVLERLAGPEAVGLYGAAYRLLDVFKVVPNLAERALYPVLSRSVAATVETRKLIKGGMTALGAVTIPLAIGTWALAGPLIALAYGHAFAGAAGAWTILMVALVLGSLGRPLLVLLRAQGRLGVAILVSVLATLVNLGLNLWLIPAWHGDIQAPALNTVIAEAIVLCGFCLACRGQFDRQTRSALLRLIPAAAAMAIVVGALRGRWPWIAGIAGAGVYVSVLWSPVGLGKAGREGLNTILRG